jgi:hypothetical protein
MKLNARESDPVTMQLMVGSPPPPDKLIRFADDSWFRFPRTRWSFSHVQELMPTKAVGRGSGPVSQFPRAERTDFDALTFQPLGQTQVMTWAESLDANFTDGILILHRGQVVYERYFGALAADRPHIAFSVTKSFVATVAAMLVEKAPSTTARPWRVISRSWPRAASATPPSALDMPGQLDYVEDYVDRSSAVWRLSWPADSGAAAGLPWAESFFDFSRR